jgi:hypothetical protein
MNNSLMPAHCLRMAHFLAHLRTSGRGVPVNAAEALLLIAGGVDHVSDLGAAMTDEKGQPLSGSTAARLVSLLRGRARYAHGRWIESPFSLIEIRSHPHRRGQQLRLSQQGQELISQFFPSVNTSTGDTDARHLGVDLTTCDED